MKSQDLKLEFIENGRLSNAEMTEVIGGNVNCRRLTECTDGVSGYKRECNRYRDCDGFWDKLKCSPYLSFSPGFEYTFDASENVWYADAL